MTYSTINHDNSNGDVSQLANVIAPERRQARDGSMYTAEEFQQSYGDDWENYWNWADRVHTTVLPAQLAAAASNVSQLAAASATERMKSQQTLLQMEITCVWVNCTFGPKPFS